MPKDTYIVTTHPDPQSLTVAVAEGIAEKVAAAGASVSIRNLNTTGFNPVFTDYDMLSYRAYLDTGEPLPLPDDVAEEQARVDSAEALVLVFPVYWWSMPSQLKGWFERVFTGEWSWGRARQGQPAALTHTSVHVVALAATSEERFIRHGYMESMRVQVEHGILEYNGFASVSWTWLWLPGENPAEKLEATINKVAGELTA